ncbi:hypothetical protein ACFYY1_42380 [Streptomyces sp. NPDC001890]|uniref:hypothetical protein n=1 Tax=Streptomyces sp. NPDC001890 TaxID=3364620 RepID=UPI0036A39FF8
MAASIASLTGARPEESGLVSGINNAVFRIGAALGIAIASWVALAFTIGSEASGHNDGFRAGFLATAIFASTGLATALLLLLHRPAERRAAMGTASEDEEVKPVTAGH